MVKHLLSQLAHVELLTAKPEETVEFLRDVLGLEESYREEQSVYFRGWGEFFHHSLKVTEAEEPGLGHIGWRAEGEEELQAAVRGVEATGLGEGWTEGENGHGPGYRFLILQPHFSSVRCLV